MKIILDYYPLIIYVLLFTGLKISERAALNRPGNNIRKGWGDWTVWLILVPMWLVLIGPAAGFIFLGNRPSGWEVVSGWADWGFGRDAADLN